MELIKRQYSPPSFKKNRTQSYMDFRIYFCYKLRTDSISGLVSHFETSEKHQLPGSGRRHKCWSKWTGESPKSMMSTLILSTVLMKNANEQKQDCKHSKGANNTNTNTRFEPCEQLEMRARGKVIWCVLTWLMYPTYTWLIGCICQQTRKCSLVQQISKTWET